MILRVARLALVGAAISLAVAPATAAAQVVPKALVISDSNPWGVPAVQDELTAQGVAWDLIPNGQIDTVVLDDYTMVFILSCQSDPLYNQWNANLARYDEWVFAGGFLAIHGCNRSCGAGSGAVFPWPPGPHPNPVTNFPSNGSVADPTHPLMMNVVNPSGSSLAHTTFTSTGDPSDTVLITAGGDIVYFEREWGAGAIAVGGLTYEFGYVNSQTAGQVLRNEVTYGQEFGCEGGELDSDLDGVGDLCDLCPFDNPNDDDDDDTCNSVDVCPGGSDTIDIDGDGVADGCDACPLDALDDQDGDGLCDSDDICPTSPSVEDSDGDGRPDLCDVCPDTYDDQADLDGDGAGDACDCDRYDASAYPGASEACDGVDNDCDGLVDDPGATGEVEWNADFDGDGFGDPENVRLACTQPVGYLADADDCDDTNAAVYPDAEELCDELDNDCDGEGDPDDLDCPPPVAVAPPPDACGCDASGAPLGSLAAAGLLALLARRRRAR